ncbi:3-isopropylmalate dehydratase small subunit [Sporosalibacterium faouarense]|uniref:3-isopropylmalate dehydratase small subunit n=1 Tax=Sporosalibacterium faouarense TaxID=516123 RepID=UPI00141D207D|nr:3-isopropylmalate dehydratase small subunit [Sporosalibacterium faouarense]MTI49325.1 3-isopropylmalate dehydratase small subunit [Bacillota bacterium]
MNTVLKGKTLVYGKNIDTDQIYPGRYLELVEPQEIASHAMEGVDPNFSEKFNKGDIIIADKNFGCGSSREHAVITLKTVGVSAIISESFARIFYRNSINLGLPLIICQGILDFVNEGDELEVHLIEGKIKNITTGKEIFGEKLPSFVLDMIAEGGIKQYYIKKKNVKK